jgi:hypothetical protein
MSRPTPLVFFSIGAVVDFVFGLVKWHSVVAGIVAIVCGLPLTGLLFLGFRSRSARRLRRGDSIPPLFQDFQRSRRCTPQHHSVAVIAI